eukprot:scaffold9250_cov105-Isochrysis_galbana.AAC.9
MKAAAPRAQLQLTKAWRAQPPPVRRNNVLHRTRLSVVKSTLAPPSLCRGGSDTRICFLPATAPSIRSKDWVVDRARDDADLRVCPSHSVEPLRAAEHAHKHDAGRRHTGVGEHADGHHRRASGGEHRVAEDHGAAGDVVGQLRVEELGLRCLLVALDQNLAHRHFGQQRAGDAEHAVGRA